MNSRLRNESKTAAPQVPGLQCAAALGGSRGGEGPANKRAKKEKLMRRVGIVGLGDMGMGMARNIIKGGFPLTGYDLRDARLAELEEAGGTRAASCKEVGESSDAVFVMVLNGQQVKEVIFGDGGLAEGLKPGSTVIVSATIHPSEVKELVAPAAEKGLHLIDTPVSGGKSGAEDGALTMMTAAKSRSPRGEPRGPRLGVQGRLPRR